MTIETEINQQPNNQEYQPVASIGIKKVSEGDVGFDSAMEISVKDESTEEIEKLVREKIKGQHWWLQEYWQEKGSPKEQINIEVGGYKIVLYNFGDQLQQRHLGELKRVLEDFSKVDEGRPMAQQLKYILLDDKMEVNPNTGEEKRGAAGISIWEADSAIKLYPRGTKFDDYRQEETSNFKGVSDFEASLIHELAHRIGMGTDFETRWKNTFGWKDSAKQEKNTGGSDILFETTQPERCVSDYAKFSPSEDICESVVAALRKPDVLDPEKLQFIEGELLQDNESLPVSMDRREGAGIELPEIGEVNYKIGKKLKIRSRKKSG